MEITESGGSRSGKGNNESGSESMAAESEIMARGGGVDTLTMIFSKTKIGHDLLCNYYEFNCFLTFQRLLAKLAVAWMKSGFSSYHLISCLMPAGQE